MEQPLLSDDTSNMRTLGVCIRSVDGKVIAQEFWYPHVDNAMILEVRDAMPNSCMVVIHFY